MPEPMTPPDAPSFEQRPMAPFDWLLLVTAAGIWGSSFLFMDIALDAEHPGLVAWLRPLLGLAFMAGVPSARRPVDRSDNPRLFLLGLLWMAVPLSMFPLAQTWIDSSIAGMMNSGMPVTTLIAGATLFGVATHRVQVVGVAVGIVGLLMIGIPTASVGDTSAVGVLLVVLAVSCYGVAANIAGPLQRRYGSPAVLLRVLVVASLATTPWGLVGLAGSGFAWSAVAANLAVGVGGTGIAYVAAASLIGRVGPVRMSAVTYVVPVVAAVLGVTVLGETLGALQVSGALVLVGGAWLTTRSGP
ncbi:MAG: EamA family transporter [Actinobacteria bacterium]|jgi:drug/metabolite transporter (DMT)-like permease|nr:EamA family transporter [Actinomycetota bacterium]MCS5672761.1 DMT family transporter [Acidimicrobiales bacterium]